ncbi:MAG: polyamine aminopropyltransferase [Pseudomonadota bacterium]
MSQYLVTINGETWFKEEVTEEIGHALRVDKVLYEGEVDHQHLIVFENAVFGRLFALNGFIQVSTQDEFIYHEMVTHVPIFAHGAAKRVLVIGGGDGGAIREIFRHKTVEHVTMVEIEASVVDFSKEWFPEISDGAFSDPRLDLVIADGAKYVAETDARFDVIIVDSTDPVGPGKVLFTKEFYRDCRKCLTDEGIMITQCGLPFLQPEELKAAYDNQRAIFDDPQFYAIAVPAYSGGIMTLGFARAGGDHPDLAQLKVRMDAAGLSYRYYTAEGHLAAFAVPVYVDHILQTGTFTGQV